VTVSFVIIDDVFAYLSFLFPAVWHLLQLEWDYWMNFGVSVTFRPHVGLFLIFHFFNAGNVTIK